MTEDRLAIGSNNPPPEEALQVEMAQESGQVDRRLTEIEAAVARVPAVLSNEDEAARLADFLATIAAAKKDADSIRARLKAPFLHLAQMVENHFRRRLDRLEAAEKALRPRLKAWQDEKARQEREEREREAEQRRAAAAKAAAEKAAKEAQERQAREARERAEREAEQRRQAAAKAEADRLKAEADALRAAERAQKAKDEAERKAAAERAAKAAERLKRASAKVDTAQQAAAAAVVMVEQAATTEAETARDARQARQAAVSERSAAFHAEKQVEQSHKAGRVRGDYGSMATLRKVYDFKVIDIDLVPRKYLRIDEPAIRAAINQGGEKAIPGLEIYEDTSTTVRG